MLGFCSPALQEADGASWVPAGGFPAGPWQGSPSRLLGRCAPGRGARMARRNSPATKVLVARLMKGAKNAKKSRERVGVLEHRQHTSLRILAPLATF
jgi:hypothetical protein